MRVEQEREERTFCHETLQGALAAVKEAYGPGAFIVQTRQIQKGGFLGLNRRNVVEVVARPEGAVPPKPQRPLAVPTQVPVQGGLLQRAYAEPRREPAVSEAGSVQGARRIERDMEGLRKSMDQLMVIVKELALRSRERDELAGLTEELQALHAELLHLGVRESLSRQLVQELNHDLTGSALSDPVRLREELRSKVSSRIRVAQPLSAGEGGPRVSMFIGATGVGKTTSISKLAGHTHHYQRLDVALMTIDTYRIAATDQLHRVADIVDVPLRVETSPEGLKRGLRSFADKDLVLIDTAGRSQRDGLQMNELKSFIEAAKPHEVHLVLPATADIGTLEEVLELFGPLANRILLTKVDEASRLGPLLGILLDAKLPVSYCSFGQGIPEDIEGAEARALTRRILGPERRP